MPRAHSSINTSHHEKSPQGQSVPRKVFSQDQIREIFKRNDTNGDGRLSKAEIKKAFNELGALIPSYRAYCGLNRADGNGDGFVDKDELEDLVAYTKNLGYTIS